MANLNLKLRFFLFSILKFLVKMMYCSLRVLYFSFISLQSLKFAEFIQLMEVILFH